jgi:hypothetical protein
MDTGQEVVIAGRRWRVVDVEDDGPQRPRSTATGAVAQQRFSLTAVSPPSAARYAPRCDSGPMADELADSFLALVDEAFRRLLDEPDADLHVTGFAEGEVAFVLTRDGLEVRRRGEVYGSEN